MLTFICFTYQVIAVKPLYNSALTISFRGTSGSHDLYTVLLCVHIGMRYAVSQDKCKERIS